MDVQCTYHGHLHILVNLYLDAIAYVGLPMSVRQQHFFESDGISTSEIM